MYCANRQQTPCGVHQGCLTGNPRASILFNASPSVQIGEGDPALWAKAVRDHPGPQCQCFDMLQHVQFKEDIWLYICIHDHICVRVYITYMTIVIGYTVIPLSFGVLQAYSYTIHNPNCTPPPIKGKGRNLKSSRFVNWCQAYLVQIFGSSG